MPTYLDVDRVGGRVMSRRLPRATEMAWKLRELGNGYVAIRNKATGTFLCVEGDDLDTSPRLVERAAEWKLFRQVNGSFAILNRLTGRYLDVDQNGRACLTACGNLFPSKFWKFDSGSRKNVRGRFDTPPPRRSQPRRPSAGVNAVPFNRIELYHD